MRGLWLFVGSGSSEPGGRWIHLGIEAKYSGHRRLEGEMVRFSISISPVLFFLSGLHTADF